MNPILVLIIFLVGVACCHGQTPDASTWKPSDEDRKRWADADARRKAERLATVNPSADTIVATVLDKTITTKDATRLNGIVFGTLLEKYASENKIVPTEAELNTFLVGMDEAEKRHLTELETKTETLTQELKSTTLTEQQRKDKEDSLQMVRQSLHSLKQFHDQNVGRTEQMRPMKLGVAKQVVTRWKVNQALYAQYGGRVIFQQAGAEPMDAYRAFLKEEQNKGEFKILDAKDEVSFWEYFDVANTSVYSKEEGDKAINNPWWTKNNPGSH